ncbi:MAG: amino acid permease [Flavobacteriaceae bacterium]|nr:amino acid permease [Flavobacteriaceae bacterium]
MGGKSTKIGLITATSLVVGNMIGSGIFVLPAALAKFGSISLLGWVFTAAGALILAKIFSNLSKIIVNRSGGPYVFAKEGFGDFIGFLVAWGYWISCWVTNAGIAVAIISALTIFFPVLETNSLLAVILGLGFIWLFTWINIKGVPTSGKIQVATTILKLLPLVFIILIGAFFFSLDNFPDFNISGKSDLGAFSAVATLTLFAFLGIESATIPAENVDNPEKIVPRATMLGSTITTLVYILGTVVLFGILPIDQLMTSPAPFAEAGRIIGGEYTAYFIAFGAAISAIGALNGWILIAGQLPMATAKDQMFPRIFKKQNKNEAPYLGIIIGSILSSVVMLMNFSEALVDQFEFIALLTTLTVLIPYLFVAAAYVLITINRGIFRNDRFKIAVLSILGFTYSFWAIYGSGSETAFYGLLLLLAGVPFFVLMKWNQKKE